MWQRFAEAVESFGTRVYLNTRVRLELPVLRYYTTLSQLVPNWRAFHKQYMPLTALSTDLTHQMILQALQNLSGFPNVALIVDAIDLFPDN